MTVTTSAVVVADLGVRDGYGLLGWLKKKGMEKKEMEERREGGRDRDRKLKKKGRWGRYGVGKEGVWGGLRGSRHFVHDQKGSSVDVGSKLYMCREKKSF